MHNLSGNFTKFHEIAKEIFDLDADSEGNLRHYPRKPKCSDLIIIALAVSAEALGIDSENLLYSKVKTDYTGLFKLLPHRSNYNRRKRRLSDHIDSFAQRLVAQMDVDNSLCIIDSMPLPVCRFARASRLKILRDDPGLEPKTAYSAIDKTYYHGYKLHCLTRDNGTVVNFCITQANVHDVKELKDLSVGFISSCTLIGDKGYISKTAQLDLFESEKVAVVTPKKKNQKGWEEWSWEYRKTRKRIETTFSQFCDQFLIKRNYAKKLSGFYARIVAKVCAFTILQFINFMNGRPLNQVKHALAF